MLSSALNEGMAHIHWIKEKAAISFELFAFLQCQTAFFSASSIQHSLVEDGQPNLSPLIFPDFSF